VDLGQVTGDKMRPFSIIEAQMGAQVETKSGIKIVEFFISKYSKPHQLICISQYGSVLTYSDEGIYGFDDHTRKKFEEMDLVIVDET